MAKGGKGRKGGGGGGGKTRKYTRDNNGRFASTGTGATARGGRLLTAKGNKRKTKTMEAGGTKAAGTIKGKVKRDPGAAGKIGQSKAAAKPTTAKAAPKGKTKTQTLQQADRIMGKLAKRQASIQVDKVGLDEGMRQVQRNNKRGGIVNRALNKRGLLGEYQKLTAGADPIRMTAAGKGIKQPTAKPAKATKAPKGQMRATKRVPFAPNSAAANRLAMFKSDKQLTDQRTKSLRAGLKKETNPLQKIQTGSSISSLQLKSKSYGDQITRMQARPIMGKRAGGRGDKPVSGPAEKRPNAIKGKPRRDASVAAKVKPGTNLNAKKYPAIYRDRANTKGKAAAKAAKRPMR